MIYETSAKIFVAPTRQAALGELLQYGILPPWIEPGGPLAAYHIVTTIEEAKALAVSPETPYCIIEPKSHIDATLLSFMALVFDVAKQPSDVLNAGHADVAIRPELLR